MRGAIAQTVTPPPDSQVAIERGAAKETGVRHLVCSSGASTPRPQAASHAGIELWSVGPNVPFTEETQGEMNSLSSPVRER
jgi:hypothetical protein